MGIVEHVNLVLIAQSCAFQRFAEVAVKPRHGGKVMHARIADMPDVFEEQSHVAQYIHTI